MRISDLWRRSRWTCTSLQSASPSGHGGERISRSHGEELQSSKETEGEGESIKPALTPGNGVGGFIAQKPLNRGAKMAVEFYAILKGKPRQENQRREGPQIQDDLLRGREKDFSDTNVQNRITQLSTFTNLKYSFM